MDNSRRTCRNCCFWGPECGFEEKELVAYAKCHHAPESWSRQDTYCSAWRQRVGQPLGTGILPIWFQEPESDWKLPASIIHDLLPRCAEADLEWRAIARMLARKLPASKRKKLWRKTVAETGYGVITVYRWIREII